MDYNFIFFLHRIKWLKLFFMAGNSVFFFLLRQVVSYDCKGDNYLALSDTGPYFFLREHA